MSLDFPDDVFLQDLPFEPLERVLKRLALLKPYLSQSAPPTLARIPIRIRAGIFSIDCSVILSKSTCFGIAKPGSRRTFFQIELQSFSCRGCTYAHPAAASSLGTASLLNVGSVQEQGHDSGSTELPCRRLLISPFAVTVGYQSTGGRQGADVAVQLQPVQAFHFRGHLSVQQFRYARHAPDSMPGPGLPWHLGAAAREKERLL